jgi:hypothetical protein
MNTSGLAPRAVLSQEFDGVRQPIAYALMVLNARERKVLFTHQLEGLAVCLLLRSSGNTSSFSSLT